MWGEKENPGIALATDVFYFEISRKKKPFIGWDWILKWYNNYDAVGRSSWIQQLDAGCYF